MTARYIAIDWGSTNLRAWLYQGDHCLDSRQSEAGVTRLNGKSPAAVLAEVTTGWREENTPVVMAGMVGSNVGWKVAPYLSVPARFSSIGEQLTSVGDNIWIIPGLCVSHDDDARRRNTIDRRAHSGSFLSLCHARYALQMGAGR